MAVLPGLTQPDREIRTFAQRAAVPTIAPPSFREVRAVASRYKLVLVLGFVIPVLAAFYALSRMTPQYQGDAEVLVRYGREYLPQTVIAGGGGEAGPATTMLDTINTEIEILRSDDLTREVLRKETIERIYPKLAAAPLSRFSVEDTATKAFRADLSVGPVKLSNVIAISLRSHDPSVATETLRLLLAGFQQRHIDAFRTNHSLLLDGQLQEQTVRLLALERERASYMAQAGLHSVNEQRAKHMQELQETLLRKQTLSEQMAFLNNELAAQPEHITTGTSTRDSEVAQDNQRRLRDLEGREHEMLSRYPTGSRMIDGVEAELRAARQFAAQTSSKTSTVAVGPNPVVSDLRGRLVAAGSELAPLDDRIAGLRAAAVDDDAKLSHLSEAEVHLADLDRQITQLNVASSTLHQRLEDAHYLDDLDRAKVASLKVIQQPVAFSKPVYPSTRLFLAFGVVVGLVTDATLLLLGLSFGVRVSVVDTVERVLDVPVVAILPATSRREMRRIASAAQMQGALASAPASLERS